MALPLVLPVRFPPSFNHRASFTVRCCSGGLEKKRETPRILNVAVSGVTELLRLFSPSKERVNNTTADQTSVNNIDDIVAILESDYTRAYFLTGNFTSSIYAEDCSFEDPTIKFRGKDLYARNLGLLVPFFDCPSLVLKKIEKGSTSETEYVLATWQLRTYLKLPWRPLISVEGTTVYDLDADFKIVRHAESWNNVSALEAIGQIFTPSFSKSS